MDTALPGKHTRALYDAFKWREASILAQLRTGMARLNGYLYRIEQQNQTNVPVGKQRKPSNTSSFDARGG